MKFFIGYIALLSVAVTFGAVVPDDDDTSDEFVLPEGIKTCAQDDPQLNECLRDTIQEQLPLLHKGSKPLNIPALDPFEIETNRFEYTTSIASGVLVLKDVKVYGLSRTTIKDVRAKFTDNGFNSEIDLFIPRLFIEGNYKADVKINDIKLRPKGYFNLTLTNVENTSKTQGVFEQIRNNKYLRLVKFDVFPEVGDMKIYATGLVPNVGLNNIILEFVNQYWPEMYKVMLPQTKIYWEPMLLESANQFMLNVPFEKLITKSN